ncbi:TPA: hypothetical protein N0F65_000342 [Lagenidium giganteum]|uniref:FYVE-type domain-containing protein n=1 Tax=Lagenidium giganteum TaxID=4803 RepID=A0AAV2YHI5_9STRA|nr:TPA: hypothetical protein N0F65_000342 [Lagenidium giganteum]
MLVEPTTLVRFVASEDQEDIVEMSCTAPNVRVDDNKWSAWKDEARQYVEHTLQKTTSWYYRFHQLKEHYKVQYDKKLVRGYVRKTALDAHGGHTHGPCMEAHENQPREKDMMCQASLDLQLSDIAYGLYCDTTDAQRSLYVHLYDETLLDGAVLQVAERHTDSDPFHFLGLKWIAFTSPAPGLFRPRDYVLLEYSGTSVDVEGRTVLFQYIKSVSCPETAPDSTALPPTEGAASPRKGSVFQVNIFRYEGTDSVKLFSHSSYDPEDNLPSWLVQRSVHSTFGAVQNLNGLADARAVVSAGMLHGPAHPKKKQSKDAKHCLVCQKRFSMLRQRHTCHACDQAACKHCIVNMKFFGSERADTRTPSGQLIQTGQAAPIVTEKFCLRCVIHARSHRTACMRTSTSWAVQTSRADSARRSTVTTEKIDLLGGVKLPLTGTRRRSFDANDVRSSTKSSEVCTSVESSDSGLFSGDDDQATSYPSRSSCFACPEDSTLESTPTKVLLYEPSSSSDRGVSSKSTTHPVTANTTPSPPPPMFHQMAESIAAQEALLSSMKMEQRKLQMMQQMHRSATPPHYRTHYVVDEPSLARSPRIPDDERFEIIS